MLYRWCRLGYHKLQLTAISLKFFDRTIKMPNRKIVDVTVMICDFEIIIDFIVLDMEEDVDIP